MQIKITEHLPSLSSADAPVECYSVLVKSDQFGDTLSSQRVTKLDKHNQSIYRNFNPHSPRRE